jgi:ribosomal protein L37AE/L43A
MARHKKRPSRHSRKSTPLVTYTVTVGHEPGSECDSCAQPRPVLIEQESGAWVCQVCLGGLSGDAFWKMALIDGVYSWGGTI